MFDHVVGLGLGLRLGLGAGWLIGLDLDLFLDGLHSAKFLRAFLAEELRHA